MTFASQVLIDESHRQRALDSLRVVDSLPEAAYEDVVRVAAAVCGAPIALVSLVDRDRQWFKARIGLDMPQTSRDVAICDHAIRSPEQVFEVGDLRQDARFADNPLVTAAGGARFYAGMPLVTSSGAAVGTVCVLDERPRALSQEQREALQALSRITVQLLEGRAQAHEHAVYEVLQEAVAGTHEAGYAVAILEVQDLAGAAARLGERALDKALAQLDKLLPALLDAERGDTLDRVTGSGEFIAVLHGADVAPVADRLREAAAAQAEALGLRLLMATARSERPDEAPHLVFARALAALSAAKDLAVATAD